MPTDAPGRLVVIGSSAGGLPALIDLLSELPPDYPIPVVVAAHGGPDSRLLEALETRRDIVLPVRRARDGMALEGGAAHVLPGATHGFVMGERLHLSPLVYDSGFRPSIDALFMTAAASYGPGAVAVILSGTMDDGMRGAQVIYDMGGRTIVQDPDEAARAEMPRTVIANDHPREVLAADDLGRWLAALARPESSA